MAQKQNSDFFNKIPQKVCLDILVKCHNSPPDSSRELFRRSNHSPSLLVSTKKLGRFGIEFSVGDVILGVV